jgi:acetyl-CoA C-acetyltransferase
LSQKGLLKEEIAPVKVPGKKGDVVVAEDEEIGKGDIAKFPTLRPAFKKDGTVTAANASSLNDGAAALVVMSAARAQAMGLRPLARILGEKGYLSRACFQSPAGAHAPQATPTLPGSQLSSPSHPLTPCPSLPSGLESPSRTSSTTKSTRRSRSWRWPTGRCAGPDTRPRSAKRITARATQLMGLDHSRVNVNGGAVALGHPIGCSGARIVGTLMHVLKQRDATIGCASICNGGGGASAIIIERL